MRYRIVLTAYDFQTNAFGLNRFMLRPLDKEVGGVFGAYRVTGTTIGRKYHESATGGLWFGLEAGVCFGGAEKKAGKANAGFWELPGGKWLRLKRLSKRLFGSLKKSWEWNWMLGFGSVEQEGGKLKVDCPRGELRIGAAHPQ